MQKFWFSRFDDHKCDNNANSSDDYPNGHTKLKTKGKGKNIEGMLKL